MPYKIEKIYIINKNTFCFIDPIQGVSTKVQDIAQQVHRNEKKKVWSRGRASNIQEKMSAATVTQLTQLIKNV